MGRNEKSIQKGNKFGKYILGGDYMIFITVGTHEQPFDRLLKCIDNMIDEGIIKEEVFCQKGFSEYEPKNYKSENLIPYEKMQDYIKRARIIITHGGPASFLDPLKYGKIPIVVPRKKEFGEHVNNHQLDFSLQVEKRMKNILVADSENDIKEYVINYDKIIKDLKNTNLSNNDVFCSGLKKIIDELIK